MIIAGQKIPLGARVNVNVPVVSLYTDTDVNMPVHIIRSKKPGPVVLVCAAIHGDELNGIDIVRRLIQLKSMRLSSGSLILVPIVNVYGVIDQNRYLPDRRDLNRSFPGSAKGTFAGRVAEQFMKELVELCDYGIDLHTGAIHRSNLPQIRANLKDAETLRVARSFGAPVILNSELRDGSLRQAAIEKGIRFLVYEAGQALRFDEVSIRAGVKGVLNVLTALGMKKATRSKSETTPYIANNSAWVRSGDSGIVSHYAQLGDQIKAGDLLAVIRSPMGEVLSEVRAAREGIVIGKQNIPLTYEGEAVYHIAFFDEDIEKVANSVDTIQQTGAAT
jgi:predicted deacylase